MCKALGWALEIKRWLSLQPLGEWSSVEDSNTGQGYTLRGRKPCSIQGAHGREKCDLKKKKNNQNATAICYTQMFSLSNNVGVRSGLLNLVAVNFKHCSDLFFFFEAISSH